MRLFRQALLYLTFGWVIALFTLASWFTIWPIMAFMDWLFEGEVNWRCIWHDSLGMWEEFDTSVRNVR